jgi:hypothetical protein
VVADCRYRLVTLVKWTAEAHLIDQMSYLQCRGLRRLGSNSSMFSPRVSFYGLCKNGVKSGVQKLWGEHMIRDGGIEKRALVTELSAAKWQEEAMTTG